LNTGLGNDTVRAHLTSEDGFFVVQTSGGSATGDPIAHADAPAGTDNDTVDATTSTIPLVIIGGFGNDTLEGGSANDVILGDLGHVQYVDLAGNRVADFGFGGRGDVISDKVVDPRWVFTYMPDMALGGTDTLFGNAGEDILIGGAQGDAIDGGSGDDLIFGDAVQLFRRDVNPYATGDITNPRFQGVTGPMYAPGDATGTAVDNGLYPYRDEDGHVPDWAEYLIVNLYHSTATPAATYGSDYIAGGPGSDEIFAQLGDDTVQGDGSIVYTGQAQTTGDGATPTGVTCSRVGATWNQATGAIAICASRDNIVTNASDTGWIAAPGGDGNDYIEGNGGNDIVFGNQGQDDIIGGSSNLFTLTDTARPSAQRPDGSDLLFGGSGTNSTRNDLGAATQTGGANGQITTNAGGNAHDADVIVGDNGDIFRLVAAAAWNGDAAVGDSKTGFLTYNYDLNGYPGPERIIPRAVALLDYTPGGFDFNAARAASDRGAADLIHGESGNDVIYGMVGNDVLYGDAQDDVIVGGYGADWISGGTGDDGILGDDGRLSVSRDSAAYDERLYGIAAIPAANINLAISTPGNMQQAITNPDG